ncbi:cob(I)yrinic acid a,c-diamide adenosyltransferase [Methanocella sp. CWC-04]|uniref:Cob(I)yrinic acid a,c-diamide adenosyltransferase n=1 Tax=Methanooceanicella nereidis TaxID=2052831 RepID=A0AAP2RD82_9EURY|nr:cob(I)yrinic acid a,c-diamide adenosyltransferase [Methanocella sp. CWC-04]MCD1295293.1 cob(I)yrinic acid a,c-diamide adenosyltransferase [Methanocella sp. CWC-04]
MGHIYLYYGTGAGKTTSALGLALRSVGHDHKVVIIQFMKWWKDTGEYRIKEKLKPYYEIYQFGMPGWISPNKARKKISEGGISLEVREIDEADKEMARKGLEFAGEILKDKPDLLVLDEVSLAVHMGLISVNDVLNLLNDIPDETDIVLTGRYAPDELIERADFVNEMVDRKAPEKFVSKKGIQF